MSHTQSQSKVDRLESSVQRPVAADGDVSNVGVFGQENTVSNPAAFPLKEASAPWHETVGQTDEGWRTRARYARLLAFADVIAIALALFLTIGIRALTGNQPDTFRIAATVVLMFPSWFVVAYVGGLYNLAELRISHGVADELAKVVIAVTAWSWLLLVVRVAVNAEPPVMAGPILLWIAAIVTIPVARSLARGVMRSKTSMRSPVAVIGYEDERTAVVERIERHPEWGLDVAATFDLDSRFDSGGATSEILGQSEIGRVIIAGGPGGLAARTELVNELVEFGMVVDVVSGGPESIYSNALLHDLEGLPVLSVRPTRLRPLDLRMKRIFDLTVASFGLLVLSPVLAWAAIRIKLDSKGPVFFRQPRCGQDGSEIGVLKLRTMVDGADDLRDELRIRSSENGDEEVLFKLEDDPRVTRIGSTLRKWSIDEIPQLLNVLKGDMSIVGPRPLPFDEANQATGVFWARTRVKPGLAGPWQAYGRSTIPFEDMIRLDYSYAVGWSMAQDFRLMIHTAGAVFGRRGAY